MAGLASIPEAIKTHPSNFNDLPTEPGTEQHGLKTKHRIFPVAKRHTRVRHSVRLTNPRSSWYDQPNESSFDAAGTTTTTEAAQSSVGAQTTHAASTDEYSDCISSDITRAQIDLPPILDNFPRPPRSGMENRDHNYYEDSEKKSSTSRPSTASIAYRTTTRYTDKRQVPGDNTKSNKIKYTFYDGANDHQLCQKDAQGSTVDMELVNAISRNILQQLQYASCVKPGRSIGTSQRPKSNNGRGRNTCSNLPHQHDHLRRLGKDAKMRTERSMGNMPYLKASPPGAKSTSTVKTISALLPYRSEFRQAGLAVTSKDQTRRIPSYITKAVAARRDKVTAASTSARDATRRRVQLDGHRDTEESDSPQTEISFASPRDMDEWRYALVDELPEKSAKKQKPTGNKKKKKGCLPCFTRKSDISTDTDWTRFAQPKAPLPSNLRLGIGPPPQIPPPPVPRRPPRPSLGLFDNPSPSKPTQTISQSHPSKLTSRAISPKMVPPTQPHEAKSNPPVGSTSIPDAVTSQQFKRKFHSTSAMNQKDPKGSLGTRDDKLPAISQPDRKRDKGYPTDSALQFDPDHIGICCRSNRGIPSRANAKPNIPRRTSSISRLLASARLDYDDHEITDRDVLRGLHIAASAACDEEVDAYVRNKTGLRIRRFLADLIALETLGERRPDEDNEQWARRRRAETRKLKQQLRRSREINTAHL
ncbi:hypothetical protein VHEMI01817 [[Torrubiella] hemipterigena]|uniref:Uncharacterized protein n=1 Tax=[Torrubiella] hemipterigena TaxID=1531966 RepID=A0A0A1SU34_9HYPO|nr:hypothetical protein VHEMI01817 [[Torrubiella] hemipterigena]